MRKDRRMLVTLFESGGLESQLLRDLERLAQAKSRNEYFRRLGAQGFAVQRVAEMAGVSRLPGLKLAVECLTEGLEQKSFRFRVNWESEEEYRMHMPYGHAVSPESARSSRKFQLREYVLSAYWFEYNAIHNPAVIAEAFSGAVQNSTAPMSAGAAAQVRQMHEAPIPPIEPALERKPLASKLGGLMPKATAG